MKSSLTIAGIAAVNLTPFADKNINKKLKWIPIYADEMDKSDLPLHDKPNHCSAYPYDILELDDDFVTSYEYLHEPEIENR